MSGLKNCELDSSETCHDIVTWQCSSARWFSIGKDLLIDNMLEEIVVAQRMVFDDIWNAGMDIKNVDITPQMIRAVRQSSQLLKVCRESGLWETELARKQEMQSHGFQSGAAEKVEAGWTEVTGTKTR